jgi:hypothetical protein
VQGFGSAKNRTQTLQWVLDWVSEELGEDKAAALWGGIKDIVAKTLISIQPTLAQTYRSCFPEHQARPLMVH